MRETRISGSFYRRNATAEAKALRSRPQALVFAVLLAVAAMGLSGLRTAGWAAQSGKPKAAGGAAGGLRSFEIAPLEKVFETSSNASIGDINGDGHPDIVLVKGRHWQVTTLTFLGDGKGHFTPGPALPSKAVKSYSGSLADMTKSGHLDIVLSNDSPDAKLVLLNDGKGNFTIGASYGEPRWPTRNAAVGDLNGDGYPDIVAANRMQTSYYCLNDGKLHFSCHALANSPSAATVAIGAMHAAGLNDIVYACRDSCQSLIYVNDSKGNFSKTEPWGPAKSSTRAMAVADFDGDGHLDIAACHERVGCFAYLNDGHGKFSNGILFQKPEALPYSMIAADLNRDGKPEIIVGYVQAPGVVYFNDGTGKAYHAQAFGDGAGAIYGMAAGDLDGDGWPDVAVARSDAPSFVMFNRAFNPAPAK
ncbi:MAG TPA: VCBS repeat-containing protein [Bryobacteraceae bacterium]|nr:VCBS repeat-containing protein [Bryobacteraceae bacterium]